jgi:hypothetical protein
MVREEEVPSSCYSLVPVPTLMADPRLNSLHLDSERRHEFRRAREALLRACGSHTVFVSGNDADSSASGHTLIHQGDAVAQKQLNAWLSDGEFLYPLRIGVNTLGRSSDNDVIAEDPFVSRRHCAILLHSTAFAELYDTASKNGTYVNGTSLTASVALKSGDEIRISGRQYVFFMCSGGVSDVAPQATLCS